MSNLGQKHHIIAILQVRHIPTEGQHSNSTNQKALIYMQDGTFEKVLTIREKNTLNY